MVGFGLEERKQMKWKSHGSSYVAYEKGGFSKTKFHADICCRYIFPPFDNPRRILEGLLREKAAATYFFNRPVLTVFSD